MIDKALTPEEIATQYRNTMDSVNLVIVQNQIMWMKLNG